MFLAAKGQVQLRHLSRAFNHLTGIVKKLIEADGFCKLCSDFRIGFFIQPANVIAADLKHAANSNRAVLQFFVDLSVDPASQQSVRAPGKYNYQERER